MLLPFQILINMIYQYKLLQPTPLKKKYYFSFQPRILNLQWSPKKYIEHLWLYSGQHTRKPHQNPTDIFKNTNN